MIIPGVEVKVVKEVLPPQLAPSGILGLVGMTEKGTSVGRAKSWNRFVELFGAASAYSMPEAAQALANGISELVVVPMQATQARAAYGAAKASITLEGDDKKKQITICTKEAGFDGNDIYAKVTHQSNPNNPQEQVSEITFTLKHNPGKYDTLHNEEFNITLGTNITLPPPISDFIEVNPENKKFTTLPTKRSFNFAGGNSRIAGWI